MKHSRRLVMLRSYALAFAVVLSPAFLQFAYTCERGDTYLLGLEFEVAGENQIVGFHPDTRSYDVATDRGIVTVRTDARMPDSTVTYQWLVGGTSIESGMIGVGGGDITLNVPDGLSTLRVSVRAIEGNVDGYNINVDRAPGHPCTEQGILDAIAAGGGPHFFSCFGPTTVTTEYPIGISNDVILDGEGNLTVHGDDDHTVIRVYDGITAELRGFTVTGGSAPGVGGGINSSGNLTVIDSIISGNTAYLGGGGIRASGDLTLRSSIVTGNTNTLSNGSGGGIAHGGGTLTIVDSTISDNLANSGGGISSGDGTITNSTISRNIARSGGGIGNWSADLTVVNSTVTGNTALRNGAGIFNTESSSGGASLTLVNTTVSGNTAFERSSSLVNNGNLAVLVLINSVIDGECFISYGAPIAQYTIESPGETCLLPTGQWNLENVTAGELGLGPLQDNGGATFTHAPLPGPPASVAIDHIHELACQDFAGDPVTTDQRGVTRPENIDCDVGSVEGYCENCNDDLDCTVDSCDPISRTCSHSTAADGLPCDAGNGACVAGVCVGPVRQWGTAELRESSDVSAVTPRVAVESLGNVTVVWVESGGGFANVWSSRFRPGLGWGASEVISNVDVPDVTNPELAMDSDGNAVAVWAQHNGTTGYDTWSNHFTAYPTGWGTAELISGTLGVLPQIGMGSNGFGMAVWGDGDVWSNRFHLSGGGWGTVEPVETDEGNAASAKVAMSGQGNAIAVWFQREGGLNNIKASHYTWYPTPSSWGAPVLLETNDDGNAGQPQIAMDSRGNAVAVWYQFDGTRGNVWSNRYTPSGGWVGAEPIEIGDDSANAPRVAMDELGNAIAVWTQSGGIWWNRLSASGGWEGAELVTGNAGSNVEVAMNAFGNAVAVWLQNDGTYLNVWSNRYRPSGGWGTVRAARNQRWPRGHTPRRHRRTGQCDCGLAPTRRHAQQHLVEPASLSSTKI